MAGDRILKIDEKSAANLSLGEAVRDIKGRPGTVVALQVERTGSSEPKEVKITRSIISVKSVEYKMLPDKIGYLHLTAFNDVTPKMMDDALTALRKEGMRSLLLDLRNNPGGGLDVCVQVAGDFIGEGPVVYIQERGKPRDVRTAPKGSKRFGLPLVVLVNNGSASASEILSGAIQDDKVGTLLGVTTFGKGLVQTVFPLRDGSALTLTTARYLTAKMRDIDHKGITPDIVVEQPKSDDPIPPLSDKDVQANAALKLLREGTALAKS
jgi:carboxyl-terminal processing protease